MIQYEWYMRHQGQQPWSLQNHITDSLDVASIDILLKFFDHMVRCYKYRQVLLYIPTHVTLAAVYMHRAMSLNSGPRKTDTYQKYIWHCITSPFQLLSYLPITGLSVCFSLQSRVVISLYKNNTGEQNSTHKTNL